jgi:hypothetical protein
VKKDLKKLSRITLTTEWICTHDYTPREWEVLVEPLAYVRKMGLCRAPHESLIDGALEFRLIDGTGRFLCSGLIREEAATHPKDRVARGPLHILSDIPKYADATEMLICIDGIWHRSEDYI